MRNSTSCRASLRASALLVATLSALTTHPASAQTAANVVCEQAYNSCSDECVHLGVITVRCFNRCKRSYRICAVKQLVLPSRPGRVQSTQPAAVQGPAPRSMDSVQ